MIVPSMIRAVIEIRVWTEVYSELDVAIDAIYAAVMSFLSPQPEMRALTEGNRLAITFLRAGSY